MVDAIFLICRLTQIQKDVSGANTHTAEGLKSAWQQLINSNSNLRNNPAIPSQTISLTDIRRVIVLISDGLPNQFIGNEPTKVETVTIAQRIKEGNWDGKMRIFHF